jgi:hypothetical protein
MADCESTLCGIPPYKAHCMGCLHNSPCDYTGACYPFLFQYPLCVILVMLVVTHPLDLHLYHLNSHITYYIICSCSSFTIILVFILFLPSITSFLCMSACK